MKLKARTKDPFAAQQRVYRMNLVLGSLLVVSVVGLFVLAYVIMVLAVRPPTVIVKDHVNGCAPQIVTASTQDTITATDAQIFLIEMLRLRFSWTSADVHDSMQGYLRYAVADHRTAMTDYLNERIAVDPQYPDVELPREQVWIRSMIRRTLVLPKEMERIECTPSSADDAEGAWHCKSKVRILTSPLLGTETAAEPESLVVLATFLELNRTYTSHPHGLLIGTMELHPIDADLM